MKVIKENQPPNDVNIMMQTKTTSTNVGNKVNPSNVRSSETASFPLPNL